MTIDWLHFVAQFKAEYGRLCSELAGRGHPDKLDALKRGERAGQIAYVRRRVEEMAIWNHVEIPPEWA